MRDVLDRQEIEYAVSGSFALAHWGVIRATGDVDLKIRARADDKRLEAVRATLRTRGFRPVDATTYEFRAGAIELYPLEDRIDEESLERRVEGGIGDDKFWIVTPEDLILSKLREFRRTNDYKHVDDIRKLLVASNESASSLDTRYLAERITRYGFQGIWDSRVLPDAEDFEV